MAEKRPLTLKAYRLATTCATPFASFFLKRRLRKGKENAGRIHERFGYADLERPDGHLIWFHGASVGELLTAIPLIEKVRSRNFNVLVTTGTVTSAEIAKKRLSRTAIHQFLPLDTPLFMNRFFDYWQPDLALFIESDLWPNMIIAGAARSIPMIVINGRMSERSFQRWQRMPRTIEALLTHLDLCLVRTTDDAERFAALGAPRIATTGNLKLDVPLLPIDERKLAILSSSVGRRAVFAAASTHLGEEAAVIDAHPRLKAAFPGLLTVIAPRHPERGTGIAAAVTAAGLKVKQRSRGELPNITTDIYVYDTLGELGLLYRLAPIAFIGGSLIPHGGQNPIEPIKFGTVVLHGPHTSNFADIYSMLGRAKGAYIVQNTDQLTAAVAALLKDAEERRKISEAGKQVIGALGGALDRTFAALEPYFVELRLQRQSNDA